MSKNKPITSRPTVPILLWIVLSTMSCPTILMLLLLLRIPPRAQSRLLLGNGRQRSQSVRFDYGPYKSDWSSNSNTVHVHLFQRPRWPFSKPGFSPLTMSQTRIPPQQSNYGCDNKRALRKRSSRIGSSMPVDGSGNLLWQSDRTRLRRIQWRVVVQRNPSTPMICGVCLDRIWQWW